ncbi:MAG TPA: hypothetical protein VGO62_02955 [Myxococcota bacterium]
MITALLGLIAIAAPAHNDPLALALDAAVDAGAHAMVVRADAPPASCVPTRYDAPAHIHGNAHVHVRGHGASGCAFWSSVDVRLEIDALVLTRDVAAGAALDGALTIARVSSSSATGALASCEPGAHAARALKAGAVVRDRDVTSSLPPGSAVRVILRAGALAVEQSGVVVSCLGAACARTSSGRMVRGRMQDGALIVEVSP